MDAGLPRKHALEQRGDARKLDVGVARDQAGTVAGIGIGRAQHDGARARIGQLRAITRVGQESDLRFTRSGQRRDATDHAVGVAAKFEREARRDLAKRAGGAAHRAGPGVDWRRRCSRIRSVTSTFGLA